MILGALSWAALSLGRGGESESVTALPTPKRELLVYATPSGSPPFGGPEVIYRATPTGQDPVRLAPGNDPALSPDGRWVAFWRSRPGGSGRLFVISSRGGQPRALAAEASDAIVWSWDCTVHRIGEPRPCHDRARTKRAGADVQGAARQRQLHLLPDGKTLAFSHSTGSGTNILSITLPDGRIRALTSDDRSYAPLWGPRGIAFERFGINGKGGDRCGDCHGDVWLMNAAGSTPTS